MLFPLPCDNEKRNRNGALAADIAKHEIAKVKAATQPGEPEYEIAEDALLGIGGWAVKRLNDLAALKEGK
jgi:hypothetical protein